MKSKKKGIWCCLSAYCRLVTCFFPRFLHAQSHLYSSANAATDVCEIIFKQILNKKQNDIFFSQIENQT